MHRPNFTAAQTLLTVARVGTFTGAAAALNTTQSAISARMRDLERSLGYPLFVRHGRQLQLTVQARQLITTIEPLLEALDTAFQDGEEADNPKGLVRVGLAEVATEWFARQLPLLHERFPRLRFTLHVGLSGEIQDWIERGELDIGIVAWPSRRPDFRYSQVGRSGLSWVCAPSLVADGEPAAAAFPRLVRETLSWIVSEASPFHLPARDELLALGAPADSLCMTDKGLIDIALAGGGIVLMPDLMIERHLAEGWLVRLGPALNAHGLELFLALRTSQRQNAVLRIERLLAGEAIA